MHNPYRLPLIAIGPAWQTRAACAGDWDIFDKEDPDSQELAKSICKACPVKDECLVDYTTTPDRYVVAGELTPTERIRATRKTNRGSYTHGTTSGYYKHQTDYDRPCKPCRDAHQAQRRDQDTNREISRIAIADRQTQAADMLAAGLTRKEIADQLGITVAATYEYLAGSRADAITQMREQMEVLIRQGLSPQKVAWQLGVSRRTVERYRSGDYGTKKVAS